MTIKRSLLNLFQLLGFSIDRIHPFQNKSVKIYNRYKDFSMIPFNKYIANLQLGYNFRGVSGCFVECGTWRGGMSAGFGELYKDKFFYLFDSFEGLPPANEIDGKSALEWQNNEHGKNYFDNCTAEIGFAEKAMSMSGVKFTLIKGWFKDTLPDYHFSEEISVLRLDADWYESTMECLTYLYPKVKKGGLIIIDDYYSWEGCTKAVHDYLSLNKYSARIHCYSPNIAYIIKV